MIVFLTLVYVGLLFLLARLGVIRFNLFWKISPVLWFLLLNVILFIPMQWGAPSGPVGVFRNVIEIVPAVSGQVVDVPVQPLHEIEKGEVLFQIDPEPFQDEVDRLSAALVEAEQQPELLKQSVEIAQAALERAEAQHQQSQEKLQRSEKLLPSGAVTQEEYEENLRTEVVDDRAVKEAEARLTQAKLELESVTAEGENTAVAQAREELERARYDLEHSTVRAPSDGVVQQLVLRPGARVAALPMRSSLVFIDRELTRISMAIKQNQLRYVRPEQPAEIVLKYFPGMTLKAKVVGIAPLTSGGQVQSTGVVEDVTPKQTHAEPYQVVLEITDDRINVRDLRGGAVGTAAIYTERAQFTHVIRKVMLRMQAWLNYVF